MSKIIGLDMGNSAIKIKTEDFESVTPTLIAPGKNLNDFGSKKFKPDQLLDVQVNLSNGISGRYFVGKLAYNTYHDDAMQRNFLLAKPNDEVLLIATITSLAFHLLMENPKTNVEYVKIYTGLPIHEYFNPTTDYRSLLKKQLSGTHTISFLDPSFNSATVKIIVEDVEVIPEGTGAFYSFATNPESFSKNRLLVDIGRFTTDILYFSNGNFEKDSFIGLKYGTVTPIDEIITTINTKYGIERSYFQIDNILRSTKKIKWYGKEYDISEIADRSFKNFITQLTSEISEKIRLNKVEVNELDDILVAGGGAVLMANYINFSNIFNGVPVIFSENPIMANAIGCYIAGSAEESEEEISEDEVAQTAENYEDDII